MTPIKQKEYLQFLDNNRVAFITDYAKNFRVVKYPIQSKGRVMCDGPNCKRKAVSEYHAHKIRGTHEIVVYVCDKPDHQSEGEQIALKQAMKDDKENIKK